MDIVERLSAQRSTTRTTDETVGVVQIAHRLARLTRTGHFVAARVAYAKVLALFFVAFHLLFELTRELLDLAFGRSWSGRTWRRHVVRQKTLSQLLIFI